MEVANPPADPPAAPGSLKIIGKSEGADPSCTAFNGPFGKEKIIWGTMCGTRIPINKYLKELLAMVEPGVASGDKNAKRRRRIAFLEACLRCRALCEYFKLMTHYINGDTDYEQDLFVIWTGGNIITIFAKLLKNILDVFRGIPGIVLNSINSTRLTQAMRDRINVCFEDADLVTLIEELSRNGYSDLDCNVLPCVHEKDIRERLFTIPLDQATSSLFQTKYTNGNDVLSIVSEDRTKIIVDPLYVHTNANVEKTLPHYWYGHRQYEALEHLLKVRIPSEYYDENANANEQNERFGHSFSDNIKYEAENRIKQRKRGRESKALPSKFKEEKKSKAVSSNFKEKKKPKNLVIEDFSGGSKMTGGDPNLMTGFDLTRGKCIYECFNGETTDDDFIAFYKANCAIPHDEAIITKLNAFGRRDDFEIKLFVAGSEGDHLTRILNPANGFLQDECGGILEDYKKCVNFYLCLLIKKELNASLTKKYVEHLVHWCVHKYDAETNLAEAETELEQAEAEMEQAEMENDIEKAKSAEQKIEIAKQKIELISLTSFVEYLKDKMKSINSRLQTKCETVDFQNYCTIHGIPGEKVNQFLFEQKHINKKSILRNFHSISSIFQPLKNAWGGDCSERERNGKCNYKAEPVNISLASLTAYVLFCYYSDPDTKSMIDHINKRFMIHGITFDCKIQKEEEEENPQVVIETVAVKLEVRPSNGKINAQEEMIEEPNLHNPHNLQPIFKSVVSINGTKQCEKYYPEDAAECAKINTQIGLISQSLRIWFENYYERYYNWGWNQEGQLLGFENDDGTSYLREPREFLKEISDPMSISNVKITPNSITLPYQIDKEDDPDRGEFDECEKTTNANVVNENCGGLDCCAKDNTRVESDCPIDIIELLGGSKIKNIRKTNKNLRKPQKRKTKRANPRKTKQRKQPKQKISKKRSKK